MKHHVILFLLVIALSGCTKGAGNDWEEKYSDCQTLASLMKSQPSEFIKPPDCERIPQLCAKDPKGSACIAELKKYYRK